MGRVERGLYQIYDKAAVAVSQCLQTDMETVFFMPPKQTLKLLFM